MKSGHRYGKLLAIEEIKIDSNHRKYWLFRCNCGKEKIIRVDGVIRGRVRSCGCGNRDFHIKHGFYGTRTYKTWIKMKNRCLNSRHHAFADYGGRGITVCEKWLNFEGFLEDMGVRPAGRSLDRIDNNKGYSKENCKWATQKEQSNNKRNNHRITFMGKTQNITQWAEELGLNRNTLYGQINIRHVPIEIAFKLTTERT